MIVFLDTSALAKRYVFEAGSAWIHDLCDPSTGHLLFIGQITRVELTSALYRKTRDPGAHFSMSRADGLLAIFGRQLRHRAYHEVRITRAALKHAALSERAVRPSASAVGIQGAHLGVVAVLAFPEYDR